MFNIHILGHRVFERQFLNRRSFSKEDRIGSIRKRKVRCKKKWGLVK